MTHRVLKSKLRVLHTHEVEVGGSRLMCEWFHFINRITTVRFIIFDQENQINTPP
jgi:hypothetical protein